MTKTSAPDTTEHVRFAVLAPWSRRVRVAPLFAVSLAISISPGANAQTPPASPLKAQLVCEHVGVPGRVRCDVEAQVDDGRIAWADAQILDMPPFAIALKGRIGPDDATVKTNLRWRLSFGVVAKETGSSSISVRVRAVRCREKTCEALSTTVSGPLEVGS